MKQGSWAPAAMLVALLLSSPKAAAQALSDLHLGRWGGSLEMGYGTERQQLRSADGSPEVSSTLRRTQERLTVRNDGFNFIDPGFVSGSLSLTFGLLQDRLNSEGTTSSRNATLTGYGFDTTLFGALPYNASLYANRNETFLTQPFGRSDVDLENRGLVLRLREDSPLRDWGIPYFSGSVRAEQQHMKENTTSVLGQSFSRDELRNTIGFSGRKGFQTSDLDFGYELSDVSNSVFQAGNFRSQTANLNYSLDFGQSLNRRSDTRLFYYSRSGEFPFSVLNANERIQVDHLQNLSTIYQYQFGRTDAPLGATTTHSGLFGVRYRPYRDLDANMDASKRHQELPTGTREADAGQLALQYHHDLGGKGTVFGRASGRYELDDNRLAASQVSVTDEGQTAPTPLGAGAGFLLNQPFVLASSIVVFDTRGGARIATAPGTDYELLPEGDLTRIVPLPTSAIIQPGDPLAVSYVYELDPSVKYSTTTQSVSGGVDLRWIALSAGHEQSKQRLLSGQDSRFLQDVVRDNAQLDLRGQWKELRAQAGAGLVRYEATRLAYVQQRYTQLASYRLNRTTTLGFNADETFTHYTLPERETKSRSVRLTLDWYGPWGVPTTALLGHRVYEDSLQPTETINEASLRARFTYGKLDLSSTFTATDRMRGGFELSSWRLDFLAIRRF